MSIVHHVCEAGGEGYLSWALARERQLRASGVKNGARRYDMDGAQIEIIMRGEVSHVFVRGNAKTAGVLLSQYLSFAFTDANYIGLFSASVPAKPKAPVKPPYPVAPVFVAPPPGPPFLNCNPPPSTCSTGIVGGVDAVRAAEDAGAAQLAPVARAYYRLMIGPSVDNWPSDWKPGGADVNSGVGITACVVDPYGGPCYLGVVSFVWANSAGPYMQAVLDFDVVAQAHRSAVAAIDAAYGAAFAQYVIDLNLWNVTTFDAKLAAYMSAATAHRAVQIAALIREQDLGLLSQLVALPTVRPTGYVPNTSPDTPFSAMRYVSTDATSVDIVQSVWASAQGDVTYVRGAAQAVVPGTSLPTGGLLPGIHVDNVYTDLTITLHDNTFGAFPANGGRGYGYTTTGTKTQSFNSFAEGQAFVSATLPEYAEWYAAEVVGKPIDQVVKNESPISYDLVPDGVAYDVTFAFFEFYAYDFYLDTWGWLPSVQIQTKPIVYYSEDNSDFYGALAGTRYIRYPNAPQEDESVKKISLRKIIRQKVSTSGAVSQPSTLYTAAGDDTDVVIDLAEYPSVRRWHLREFLVFVTSVGKWAQPVSPSVVGGFALSDVANLTIQDEVDALMLRLQRVFLSKAGIL